jgi:hypothetical protein
MASFRKDRYMLAQQTCIVQMQVLSTSSIRCASGIVSSPRLGARSY